MRTRLQEGQELFGCCNIITGYCGKGVCLRCAGQQTDHPQEKKNGFDEMQMSTFTENLPPTSRLDPLELMKEHTVGWSV